MPPPNASLAAIPARVICGDELRIRPMVEADRAYVISTYLECLRLESAEHRTIHPSIYYGRQREIIERQLEAGCAVLVATLPDDPDVILGWLLFDRAVLHFLYVKQAFRRLGLATELLTNAGLLGRHVYYTHQTILGRHLNRLFRGLYNPYLR